MFKHISKLSFSIAVFLSGFLFATSLWAESNFEYFFKNSTAYKDVVVERVIRTDLIELESGEKIRLIGLNSPSESRRKEMPERDQHGFVVEEKASPLTSVEDLAYDFVQDLLEKKHVRLEFDTEKNDSDHHTFAYVFLLGNDLFVNVEILRQGYANLQIQPPNLKYSEKLRAAYKEAYKERRGLQNK